MSKRTDDCIERWPKHWRADLGQARTIADNMAWNLA